MSSEIAIRVRGLGKCYEIYDKPRHRLWQMLSRGVRKFYREFWALKDVSFEIKKGDTVGIIGRNGSGKSTLLQMLCGTLNPSQGDIEINGKVAALLELGAGFNPEFTGRENIFLSASLYGLTADEIVERFNQIVEFADIGNFVEQPVKTYSSGMFVRLAFAVIAHVDADILVIDEALAVGDAYFVQKCMRFLRKFTEQGTLLFVSHDTTAVVGLCNKAILMNYGVIERIGDPKDVSEYYLAMLHDERTKSESLEKINISIALKNASNSEATQFNNNDFGTGHARVVSVSLIDKDGCELDFFSGGEKVFLTVSCRSNIEFSNPLVGYLIRDRLGQIIFGGNTSSSYIDFEKIKENHIFNVRFSFVMPPLQHGEYSVSAAIGQGTQDEHTHHHWLHDAMIVRCTPKTQCFGVLAVEQNYAVFDIGGEFLE